jgi:hypothetical protein
MKEQRISRVTQAMSFLLSIMLTLFGCAVGTLSLHSLGTPGQSDFFLFQASIWGLAGFLIMIGIELRWLSLCKIDPPGWDEVAPAWAYEASFLIQTVNIPFSFLMTKKMYNLGYKNVVMMRSGDFAADDIWLESIILSSLFGMMVKDFFIHWRKPDILLLFHHLIVCGLMYAIYFYNMPGYIFFVFSTAFVEVGTAAYCAWMMWGWRRTYKWGMNASNFIPLLGTSVCLYELDEECSSYMATCYVAFFTLVVGRTYVLVSELKEDSKRLL